MSLWPYDAELASRLAAGRDQVERLVGVWFELKGISQRRLGRMVRNTRPKKRVLTTLGLRQKTRDDELIFRSTLHASS